MGITGFIKRIEERIIGKVISLTVVEVLKNNEGADQQRFGRPKMDRHC